MGTSTGTALRLSHQRWKRAMPPASRPMDRISIETKTDKEADALKVASLWLEAKVRLTPARKACLDAELDRQRRSQLIGALDHRLDQFGKRTRGNEKAVRLLQRERPAAESVGSGDDPAREAILGISAEWEAIREAHGASTPRSGNAV